MMSALTTLILLLAAITSNAFRIIPSHAGTGTMAFSSKIDTDRTTINAIQCIRGGGSDYDSEYDEYDEESDVEDTKLSASAVKALKKAQAKKKAHAKKTVSASLKTKAKAAPKKSSGSGGIFKKIPYIVRALMNPFTVFAMTKGYFASLVNIDYLQEVRFFSYCLAGFVCVCTRMMIIMIGG